MTFRSLLLVVLLTCSCLAQQSKELQPYVLIVQPIVVASDEGTNPSSMALPEELVDRAYEKAGIDFHFLEPIFYNNTKARDGLFSLDAIVKNARKKGFIKGQNDIVNLFFVNAVSGRNGPLKGPLGRGLMNGNITFIALGDAGGKNADRFKDKQAFVIAHEVGHNLSLIHAVDDPNVPNDIPNIQGDGPFKDRIDPKYSLNDYQIEIIRKSPLVHPRIEFLSKKTGKRAILDESYEPYFSQLQKREIEAFVAERVPVDNLAGARQFAKRKFASAVTEFTESEKKCLTFVTNKVNETLQKAGIALMYNHPWRFIKVEDWLCGGFAHTRGTYIILSERHIRYLSRGWSDHMTPAEEKALLKRLGSLLVHEQLHCLQRTYKTRFTRLYTKHWNFVHAKVQDEKSIQVNQVSNPDAPVAEWLIPDKANPNTYFWVRTLLKEGSGIPIMGRDFVDKVFTVQKTNDVFTVKKKANGEPVFTTVSGISFYGDSFPVKRGLDHPNEISAYMFSQYFVSLVSKTKPFENTPPKAAANSKAYVRWINEEMKEKK